MAITTGDLAFLERVVGLPAGLGPDILVAGGAKLHLGHLKVLGQAGVPGMTVVTGKPGGDVLA